MKMKKLALVSLAAAGLFLAACSMTSAGKAETDKSIKSLRVGVYDSRAVAIASVPTEWYNKPIKEKMKEMEKAKAAGDEQKIKELMAWGESRQQKAHLMGFGTAPVAELLEPVKDKLPDVARQAGVDIIISKWQIDYQASDAELVDVTDAMVALYEPSEKTLKTVEALKKHKPLTEEEILKIKD
jgi:hypothetical protein